MSSRHPADPALPLEHQPEWPAAPDGRPVVIAADASGRLERRLIREWVERRRPAETRVDILFLVPSRRRHPGQGTDPALGARLQRGDDPWVIPLRVVWLPGEHGGRRTANWGDLLKLGDPRDPHPLRQRLVLWKDPSRVSLVIGAGAGAGELLAAHRESVEVIGLVEFVARRAHLALERGERALRGNRYKVPKFVKEEILTAPRFRDGVLQIASETGMPVQLAHARARYYLGEIAASHSPFLIDLIANAIHWVYRQGYGAIIYDSESVRDIAALGQEHPLAFLPSHRSNLDTLSLQFLLWENDLPPNHTAAGINMNFLPVGPLLRRTGAFFIRRSFRANPLYKFVLQSYLDYLVERRFPLEWYLEGGRSRSGKLLPPRYGMLSWVVEAVERGRADDLFVIPTSIAYDQIQDVHDYATEAQGGSKRKESFGWVLSAVRSLRRRYGNIHIRFAEPMSIRKEIVRSSDTDVQKLAFEVMYRISRATPITPTSVVSIALLSARGLAVDPAAVALRAARIDSYVEVMGLPTTEPLMLERPGETQRILERLCEHGSVGRTETPGGPVFHLEPSQALQAAYYRNTVVHYFVPGAIAELAVLLTAAEKPPHRNPERLMAHAERLRDLLKFEFFFPEREAFREQVAEELDMMSADWAERVADDPEALLAMAPLLRAHWAVLPFLESYQIVADELADLDGELAEKPFLAAALERGRRYRREGRVGADESVSTVLYRSALDLAENRRLLERGADRAAWASELAGIRRHAERVAVIAAQRLSWVPEE